MSGSSALALASANIQKHRSAQIQSRWRDVPPEHWNDWHWQLANRLRTLDDLGLLIRLTEEEVAGIRLATERFRMEITPFFARQIDANDPACPIRRQVVPVAAELEVSPSDSIDPLAEAQHTPVPGVIHRYPDRVLFFPTLHCAAYCRFCTRSRIVGDPEEMMPFSELEPAFEYLRSHTEIRDVLISGGDPLTISDVRLDTLLSRLRSIPHLELLRIGTRVPVFLPQRITPELVAVLRKHHPLFISVHVNHAKEITPEVAAALTSLADGGIPLGGQTVLLKGINDDAAVMKKLMHELLKVRVRPYYLNHCDQVVGTAHMRTSVATGIAIMNQLRGHTSGYAVPTYVIDTPAGGGKVPVAPLYVVSRDVKHMVLRNYRGEVFDYIDETC